MAIYRDYDNGNGRKNYSLEELPIYGSERIGQYEPGLVLYSETALSQGQNPTITLAPVPTTARYIAGLRRYEQKNHLGNVLAVLTDKASGQDNNTDAQADYYLATVVQANGYYPFGWAMPGKKVENGYPYGFNSTEKVEELGAGHNTTFYREQDTRLARWWSVDPKYRKFPGKSPFQLMSNSPVVMVDPLGDVDYYSPSGDYIGSDSKPNDGNYMIISNKADIRKIRRNHRKGKTVNITQLSGPGDMLPSTIIRRGMHRAVERARDNSFHEEGGFFGTSSEGPFVVDAKPGKKGDPSKVRDIGINPLSPMDSGQLPNDPDASIEGTFHTHASGTVVEGKTYDPLDQSTSLNDKATVYSFQNEPTQRDIDNAKKRGGTHYVLAQGNETVYIYDGDGVRTSFPFKKFFSLGMEEAQEKTLEDD